MRHSDASVMRLMFASHLRNSLPTVRAWPPRLPLSIVTTHYVIILLTLRFFSLLNTSDLLPIPASPLWLTLFISDSVCPRSLTTSYKLFNLDVARLTWSFCTIESNHDLRDRNSCTNFRLICKCLRSFEPIALIEVDYFSVWLLLSNTCSSRILILYISDFTCPRSYTSSNKLLNALETNRFTWSFCSIAKLSSVFLCLMSRFGLETTGFLVGKTI